LGIGGADGFGSVIPGAGVVSDFSVSVMRLTWGQIRAMATRSTVSAALALLAGCVTQPPTATAPPIAPPPAAPVPAITQTRSLPALRPPIACRSPLPTILHLLPTPDGAAVVTVLLNGLALRMQIDTGAETSVLTRTGAARLGLTPGAGRRAIRGLGGDAAYGTVAIDRIDFAGTTQRRLTLPVMRLAGTPGERDGLIGADLLAPFTLALDLREGRLTLFRDGRCGPPPGIDASTLPWISSHDLPVITASLDGYPLTALLDTGASASAVDEASAGLASAQGGPAPQFRSYGAGGIAIPTRLHRFTRLAVGSIALANPTLRVIHIAPAIGINMVIGLDLLAGRTVWIDYPSRRAFVFPPSR
jgi:hypothetical protein